MFEFGKKYTLTFAMPNGDAGKSIIEKDMEVVSEDMPLVKFARDGQDVVINTASPFFFKGEIQS
jgi:hypothetical protein